MRSFSRVPVVLGIATLCVAGIAADERVSDFEERQRLTAVDVVVGFQREGFVGWATDPAPRSPNAGDFEVLVDGIPQPVISVGRQESWEVVVWFLVDRTRTALLRRSAVELAGSAAALTALGPVDIVVADPEPSTIARGVAAPDALRSALGELARSIEGRDEIAGLRDEVRGELAAMRRGEGQTGMEADELAAAALEEELRIVRSAHDRLAIELADRPRRGAGRLVVLVAGGYDLDPGTFWGVDSPVVGADAPLERTTRELGQLLASHGWVVAALDPEPEKPLRDGWTIGKWRSAGLGVEQKTFWDPVVGQENEQTLIGWRWKRESQRQPKKAEALLQLGRSLWEGGQPEDAVEAYQDALYHFAGHRKTAGRQAVALLGLGRALRDLGDVQEARTAFRLARTLDAGMTEEELGSAIDLRAPREPLVRWAEATAGAQVSGPEELAGFLEELPHRIRLTYQLEGWPDGRVHPVIVRLVGLLPDAVRRDPVVPRWTRRSTPEALASARLRRALAGEGTTGRLDVEIRAVSEGRLEVRVDQEPLRGRAGGDEVRWRLSVARGAAEDSAPRIEHRLGDPERLPPEGSWRRPLEAGPPPGGGLAVLVEELASGEWGLALVDG